MGLGDPVSLPSIRLPDASELATPTLLIPTAEIASYKPLVVPPSDLRSPKGVKQKAEQKEPPPLKIPILDIPIPVPTAVPPKAKIFNSSRALFALDIANLIWPA